MLLGGAAYLIGLWNAQILLNEKGYYFTLLLFGLFASVSLQKSVRDRADGIPVTGFYYAICWFSRISALVLLTIGLINATLLLSEKGFYAMAYALSLFDAVAVQKNTRDTMEINDGPRSAHSLPPALD
ncbi:inner membrane protein YiaA [Xanthomonas vasicola]|uniref:inner membrane protein YiaA n=1 Tax=Xanthomonas vasicola TaxID=56459 RepID=UPI0001CC08B2|nr:inner membrane protein YiaA [Xanthomonas vasicola]KFA38659.1 membrane protein [Xanthomonas vasicola pv. musacearum NCPPB 4384]KEZ97807.1 membrane protein [Xanthomonas vasicola pv. vasculorum NCPPB 895]KFA08281.1 membrane protein [Xanthomonas vasicola pv. musacearum NCPPB 4380]KFA09944.1 membrane protein [Xanthomonas vasicola pv. musacearum NCPPB 2005]KFA15633.1 membrane protein [Xanthomonas vasicola pv. musacearum NCPPB 4392]